MKPHGIFRPILLMILMVLSGVCADAQHFEVETFRALPNDVSAFINPVQDLNGDDCGLIKVQCSPSFVFTTPLGIVKRIDNIGEIWLYVPRGTRKLTIKHPQWGVLRDYSLPGRIDSHLTYELCLREPENKPAETIVTVVRDTLVVTRTDTLVIRPSKPAVPLQLNVGITITCGGNAAAAPGLMLSVMKRHGGFVHVSTDFGTIGQTVGTCDADGTINGTLPYYSGAKRRSMLVANAGAIHRLSGRVAIFEGIGYGSTALAWQLSQAEGAGYVRNRRYCIKGVSLEAGVQLAFKRLRLTASVTSINGKEWYGSVGIGLRLNKRNKDRL